jgi:hypothetical protein
VGTRAEELRSDIERQREDLGRDFEMIGDRVSPSRMIERRTDQVKGRARRLRDSVMGSAEGVMGSAGDAGSAVAHAPRAVADEARGNPLAAGLVAFGIGLLAGSVLPSTRRERQLARRVQPELEQAGRAAADMGREVASEMRPVVQEAGSDLGSTAKDAIDDVRGAAQDHAEDVKVEASGSSGGGNGR